MLKNLGLAMPLLLLMFGAALADADLSAEQRAEQIKTKVGVIVTELALASALDEAGLDSLRKRLAGLYHELEQLAEFLGQDQAVEAGVEAEGEEETYNPGPWELYPDASAKLFPVDTEFRGWSMDANMTVNLGDGGEIILRIENSYYLAEWEIYNGYNSHGQASASATGEGDVLVNVEDADGRHDFLVQQGGIGPIYRRGNRPAGQPKQDSPLPAPVPDQPVGESDWYSAYLNLVRSGQLESSPAMMWFIQQAQTHSYESDALRDLGEALNRMGGGQGALEPVGMLVYYVGDERRELPVPDPRTSPGAFTNVVNRAYILTQDSEVYSVEMN